MKSGLNQTTEEYLLNEIKELRRIINEMKANQSPSSLSISGLITIDQSDGTITFKDSLGNTLRVISSTKDIIYDSSGLARIIQGDLS